MENISECKNVDWRVTIIMLNYFVEIKFLSFDSVWYNFLVHITLIKGLDLLCCKRKVEVHLIFLILDDLQRKLWGTSLNRFFPLFNVFSRIFDNLSLTWLINLVLLNKLLAYKIWDARLLKILKYGYDYPIYLVSLMIIRFTKRCRISNPTRPSSWYNYILNRLIFIY